MGVGGLGGVWGVTVPFYLASCKRPYGYLGSSMWARHFYKIMTFYKKPKLGSLSFVIVFKLKDLI